MLALPRPKKILLSSGAKLLYQRNPFSPTIAFGVWISGGSSREGKNERGLSHLLEHVVFRGTKNRDALKLAYELESIGGQYDAFTGKEATCYHAKVLEEHFEKLVDIFSDLVCSPSIPEKTFRIEKRVVQEEIRSVNDAPEEYAHELFYLTLFKDHPLGHPVTGYLKDVARYRREHLVAFHKKTYTAQNATIGFVGNVSFPEVVSAVEKHFCFERKGRRWLQPEAKESIPSVRSVTRKDWTQSHVCIGARTVPARHRDRYALVILANVLGGGTTSRLFQSLRERTGLVYAAYTHVNFWQEAGALCSFFSVDAKNLERALDIFHAELSDIRRGGVREEEIASAKAQVKGAIVFGIENPESRLFQLVESEIYHGRYVTCEEILRAIERIDRCSVTEVAERYLAEDFLTYTSCGPISLKRLVHRRT